MFRLDERIALVTGGSRGIGRAIGMALGQAGATVVINFQRNEQAAREAADAIGAAGGKAELCQFDVGDGASVERGLEEIIKKHGRLDILVNNAGIALDNLLLRVKEDEIMRTFQTNVAGAILGSKTAIRSMMRKKFGRIINVSSVVGESGNPGQAVYSASKAALIGLTKTLAREYATRGVTVNAVAPGFIDTDMTASLPQNAMSAALAQTPMGRVGRPEEVAAAVVFLASDEAAYITGQVLRVNGGMYV